MELGKAAPPQDEATLAAKITLLMIPPLSGLAQSALSPLMPSLSAHFAGRPYADVLIRLMATSLSAAMIIGSLLAALLAARLGQRRLLFWSLVLYALFGAAGYLLDDLLALVGSRVLLGIVTASAGVAAAAIISTRIPPERRHRWMGFFIMSGTFGALVLLFASGQLGKADWRLAFLIYGLALPLAFAVLALVPADPPVVPAAAKATGKGGFPLGITLFGLACGTVMIAPLLFLPYHIAATGHAAADEVTRAILASALMGGIVSLCYGWLRKRVAMVPIFVAGFLAKAVGISVVLLTGTYGGAIGGAAVMGIGVGLLAPNLFAASALAADPAERARTVGFVRAGTSAAPLVAQLPLEPLSRAYGPDGALAAIAGFAAVMIFVCLAWRRGLGATA